MTKIKNLEEMSIGNVVQINNLLYVVVSDGDVPQHRVTEVALCQLYKPQTPDSEVSDRLFKLKEFHLKEFKFNIRKVDSGEYTGWKYKTVQVIK